MRVSVVAGLIVAVHVVVIGSVAMTSGCTSTRRDTGVAVPVPADPPPAPVLPPTPPVVEHPVTFPAIQPPVEPHPVQTDVAAKNVYVVKSGDSLSKIAAKHGVNTRELAELNQITDPNRIRAGQKLILPDYSKPSQSQPDAAAAAAPAKPSKPQAVAAGGTYVVKSGDALSKIAAAHGIKVKDLMEANQITNPNRIRAGQKLVIPEGGKAKAAPAGKKAEEPKPEAPASAPAKVEPAPAPAIDEEGEDLFAGMEEEALLEYTVQEGDTVEGIARLFVVRQDDIRRVNAIPVGTDVNPGQRIKIPPSTM
ncbi:MAG: LysM peptidoglycan-binding domain-containing protein [Lentisphaerae bacterium]|nr:LysM peptidoglycan-binding domain-containing protein [Lentisphaerota bacterium]